MIVPPGAADVTGQGRHEGRALAERGARAVYLGESGPRSMCSIERLFSRQTISMISVSGIRRHVSLVVNGRV